MASPDWKKIRLEYISTNCSYRDLCDKYHVALRSLARKAKEENWQQARINHGNSVATKAQQKVVEKQAETFADYAVELRQDIIDINRMLMQKVRETMAYSDAFSPRDLKSLSSMLQDLMINEEKMTADQNAAGKDAITVKFVNMEWDDNAGN